jgi:hypothetical protein
MPRCRRRSGRRRVAGIDAVRSRMESRVSRRCPGASRLHVRGASKGVVAAKVDRMDGGVRGTAPDRVRRRSQRGVISRAWVGAPDCGHALAIRQGGGWSRAEAGSTTVPRMTGHFGSGGETNRWVPRGQPSGSCALCGNRAESSLSHKNHPELVHSRTSLTSTASTGPSGGSARYCGYFLLSSARACSRSSPPSRTRARPRRRIHQRRAQSSS